MKIKIVVPFLMLVFLCSCSEQKTELGRSNERRKEESLTAAETNGEKTAKATESETAAEVHSVLCMVFLGPEEKVNADAIAAVARCRKSLRHKIHTIFFAPQSQQEKVVQDIINEYNISEFPAIVVDGRLLTAGEFLAVQESITCSPDYGKSQIQVMGTSTAFGCIAEGDFLEINRQQERSESKTNGELLTEGESLEQIYIEAANRKRINISPHLAIDMVDEKTLVVMFYVCCYGETEFIEDGRVRLYVVENNKSEDEPLINIFKALITDSKNYNVESGSCHAPETVYWQIPEGVDPKEMRVVMVVYDEKERVLAVCCSAEGCTERSED